MVIKTVHNRYGWKAWAVVGGEIIYQVYAGTEQQALDDLIDGLASMMAVME